MVCVVNDATEDGVGVYRELTFDDGRTASVAIFEDFQKNRHEQERLANRRGTR